MDVQMPFMDGITATIQLRKRGVTTPIVGLTANVDDETRLAAAAAGMNELLTKPMSIATLQNAIDTYAP